MFPYKLSYAVINRKYCPKNSPGDKILLSKIKVIFITYFWIERMIILYFLTIPKLISQNKKIGISFILKLALAYSLFAFCIVE